MCIWICLAIVIIFLCFTCRPANVYLFKTSNRKASKRCLFKVVIKISERQDLVLSQHFLLKFFEISYHRSIALPFLFQFHSWFNPLVINVTFLYPLNTLQFFQVFWSQDTWQEYTANICLFKVSNWNIRKRWEICSKLIINTPEQRHWHRFSHSNSHFFLVFLLLTWNK